MKKLISFIFVTIFSLSIALFVPTKVSASTLVTPISLNEKVEVDMIQGETVWFDVTIPDNKFYVIETIADDDYEIDTYISANLSTGTVYNDDGGENYCSMICFSNQGGRTIRISAILYGASTEGSFYLQVRKQQAVFYGGDYPEFDSTIDLTTPYNAFSSLYDSYKYENVSASHFTTIDSRGFARYNSEIMLFSGHGNKNDGSVITFVGNSSISLDSLGDMGNVRLAVWSACGSANIHNNQSTSFTHKSVINGARTAIGFPGEVVSTSARSFTNDLFTKLAQGSTVASAASYAAGRLIWPLDEVKNYVIYGDSNVTLNTPSYTKRDDNVTITTNNYINEELTNNYNDLISNHDYVCMQDGNIDRYYLTINGILTNQFVDMANRTYPQAHLEQNYTITDNIKVLPILLKYKIVNNTDEESFLVYIVENNIATPVLISYVTTTAQGITYTEAICKNLNDGSFIDYEDISIVKSTGDLDVK